MLKLLLGDPNARKLKRYQPLVSDISLLEEEIAPLSGRRATQEVRLCFRSVLPMLAALEISAVNSRRDPPRGLRGGS